MFKNTNKLFLIIALIILVIAGRFMLLKDEVVEIPTVTAVTNAQEIETVRGSYCWHSDGESICVDTAAPHEMIVEKKMPYIKVKPNEEIAFHFSQNPTSITIQQWEQDYDYKEIASSERFTAPAEKGKYIISALTRFSNGDITDTIAIEVE
ncbi:cAMP-binding protein [Lysinibacillus sp. 2017]|uniref:cAMP-binding protein n=1 Tax=unclassified Lysinibacillus TaxID=2636778 RepID=UPI000D52896B|nr:MULTISPECIES: cAMP-binding protein [unclassified Lysinibacillus]AWE07960.1 cAMP-binding protein [Lysinibacillus sp. 2017]TGN29994.1 cAMP-binding protein [Lysinibacillus sp. S2017]